jgi:hypothetical protein
MPTYSVQLPSTTSFQQPAASSGPVSVALPSEQQQVSLPSMSFTPQVLASSMAQLPSNSTDITTIVAPAAPSQAALTYMPPVLCTANMGPVDYIKCLAKSAMGTQPTTPPPAPAGCPSGYVLMSYDGQCHLPTDFAMPPTPSAPTACAPGYYQASDGVCRQIPPSPQQPTPPPAPASCDSGYYMASDGVCRQIPPSPVTATPPPAPACPDGYVVMPYDGQCHLPTDFAMPPTPTACPDGYVLMPYDGKCHLPTDFAMPPTPTTPTTPITPVKNKTGTTPPPVPTRSGAAPSSDSIVTLTPFSTNTAALTAAYQTARQQAQIAAAKSYNQTNYAQTDSDQSQAPSADVVTTTAAPLMTGAQLKSAMSTIGKAISAARPNVSAAPLRSGTPGSTSTVPKTAAPAAHSKTTTYLLVGGAVALVAFVGYKMMTAKG